MSPQSRFDLIVKNGVIVSAGDVSRYSIGVKAGKVAALALSFSDAEEEGAEIIDAEGAYVMPGGVDGHVHLCQDLQTGPHGLGGRCADDFETGSLSAICGGTTTIVTFATQTRSADPDNVSLLKVVEKYKQRADATGAYCDYGFHVIIVRNDPQVIEKELPVLAADWGITSVKLFMTYETQRLADKDLLDIMLAARQHRVTTMIHAENGDMIEWLTKKLESRGMVAPYYHAVSRPPLVEGEATNRAIALAELVRNPILFVHVGSVLGMNNVREAQTRGLPIYAETCPQYFHLTWEDLRRHHDPSCFENSKMICSPPPPPDASDKDALYIGLHNGTFTIFSSDHCPFRYDDPHGKPSGVLEAPDHLGGRPSHGKAGCAPQGDQLATMLQGKSGAFRFVPNGIPGVETRLSLLYTGGLMPGHITPSKFVELTATNPAKLYGVYPRKGCLQPGSDADIVIWHPQDKFKPFALSNSRLHHNVDYTPYEGQEFKNWPRYTILRGQVVWGEGTVRADGKTGQYLKRGPSSLSKGIPGAFTESARSALWL